MEKNDSTKRKLRKAQAMLLSAAVLAGTFACNTSVLGATSGKAQLSPQFHIIVDGTEQTFYSASGKEVHPLVYEGATYLPLRAIGELMGKNVSWDNSTKTASLSSPAGLQVTDADSFNGTAAQPSSASGLLSAETAKSKALAHAGIPADQATFTKQKLEWDSGRQIYDVTFFAGNAEYDYEIDALTGDILEFDYDSNQSAALPGASAGTLIGDAKAREIALSKVPGAAAANVVKSKLDRDDDEAKYEVEIFYGNTEYDFEIDAYSGTILEWDSEAHR